MHEYLQKYFENIKKLEEKFSYILVGWNVNENIPQYYYIL